MLRPISGAPPDAPIPDFPTEDRVQGVPTGPEQVLTPGHMPDAERVLGENELAERLHHLKKRWQYGGKVALEARIEGARLLKAKYDADPTFRGEKYEKFAYLHGIAKNKSDAHAMYVLGEFGDTYFTRCEAEARLKPNFDWPSWRKAVVEIRREQKNREQSESGYPAQRETEEEEPESESDRVAELQCERDNLVAQVKTATQQFRSERAKSEQLESQIAALRREIALKDPPLGPREVLQDVTKSTPAIRSSDEAVQLSIFVDVVVAICLFLRRHPCVENIDKVDTIVFWDAEVGWLSGSVPISYQMGASVRIDSPGVAPSDGAAVEQIIDWCADQGIPIIHHRR